MPRPAGAARGYSFQGGLSHPFFGRRGEAPVLEKFGLVPVLLALAALALLAWLAACPAEPPRALDGDTPAGAFASARALPALRQLSQAPRPVASAANARARDYIVQRLQSMDLEPEVQTATAQRISSGAAAGVRVSLGVVNNVLVRVKGTNPGAPALLVASHYDSLAGRPNGDGAAPAAAMLETLRALQHGAPLANDVIFLFADAGNSGALGARAFAGQHRWARDVGVVLQFDAAGQHGPLMLTSTRGGNGAVVAGWLAAAPLPLGSSAFEVLARAAPTLQVQGPLDGIGQAGLRFASVDGRAGNGAGLQHLGETMLALTRHFGAIPLAGASSADSVHFELPLAGHLQYSSEHVWAITRLVCFLFVLACCMAVRYLGLEPQMLVAGAMAFIMLVLALASIAITLWHGWPGLDAGYSPLAAGARDRCYLLAYVTLGSALCIELQRLMHKALGTPAVTLGALMVLLAALLGASWLLPAASNLLAWPLLAALLAYGLLHLPPVAAWPQGARMALMVAAAAPAVLLIAPLLQQVAIVFTPQRSALLMIVLSALLGLCTPVLAAVRRRFVAPLLLCVCVGAILSAGAASRESPAPGRATPAVPAIAPSALVPLPELVALRDADDGRRRRVAFSLRSHSGAPAVEVRVEGGDVLRAALDGKLLTDRMARSWNMNLYGSGARRHRIELELPSGSTARVRIAERIPGLEGGTDTLVFR